MSSGSALLQLGQNMSRHLPGGCASTNVWLESRFSSRIQGRLASEDRGVDDISRLACIVEVVDCRRGSMSCCRASLVPGSIGCSGGRYG